MQKASKESVHYRPAPGNNRCSTCAHYLPERRCKVVDGEINPDYISDLFVPGPLIGSTFSYQEQMSALDRGRLAERVANIVDAVNFAASQPRNRTFAGLKVYIENPAGSTRSGTDGDGHKWSQTMTHDYGYIKGVDGVDGDEVDVFLGPDEDSPNVYVIHQCDPITKLYDEDKVMVGFGSQAEALKAYNQNYDRVMPIEAITEATLSTFKTALKNAAKSDKPFRWKQRQPKLGDVMGDQGEKQDGNQAFAAVANFVNSLTPRERATAQSFAADPGCKWVTIGAQEVEQDGKTSKIGGSKVCIGPGGVIDKGPPNLKDKDVDTIDKGDSADDEPIEVDDKFEDRGKFSKMRPHEVISEHGEAKVGPVKKKLERANKKYAAQSKEAQVELDEVQAKIQVSQQERTKRLARGREIFKNMEEAAGKRMPWPPKFDELVAAGAPHDLAQQSADNYDESERTWKDQSQLWADNSKAQNKRDKITQNQRREFLEILTVSGEHAPMEHSYESKVFKGRRKEQVEEGMAFVNKLTNLPEMGGRTVGVNANRGHRSFQARGGIHMTKYAATKVTAHEMGHWIEEVSAHVGKRSQQFLEDRTSGADLESLKNMTGNKGYGRGEKARAGGFMNAYTGKAYKKLDGTVYATEILSMGIQHLYEDAADFAAKDPSHFAFTLMALRGQL